jgi:DtxR family Mn-dependent transcriptional regulator
MKHESFNESTEMYLKTVRELAIANQGPVPISALAEQMGVSNVSATEMVHRLRNQGLLDHVPYKGVTLTPEGQRRTTELVRSHHMWEWFLFNTLGLSWAQSHDLACRLEHATDSIVTEALAAFLGHPQHCPHGNPVPDSAGHTAPVEDTALTTLRRFNGFHLRRMRGSRHGCKILFRQRSHVISLNITGDRNGHVGGHVIGFKKLPGIFDGGCGNVRGPANNRVAIRVRGISHTQKLLNQATLRVGVGAHTPFFHDDVFFNIKFAEYRIHKALGFQEKP